ncbi:MAG TPA: pentapeptide repeat-containing protein [Pirellulaceae bacterium]|nr:pentapeptide repeat-containing protein [Pirellulaceae bacterium]
MIEIKHRETGEVLLRIDADSLAKININGEDLAHADFSGMDLTATKIASCNLSEASFRNAKMDRCRIQNCGARRTDFAGASLIEANLSDNVMDFADFTEVDAVRGQFRHAKMNGGVFIKGNFAHADFSFSELRGNFHGAILVKANLFGADLTSADLTGADLREADMTDARIQRADFNFAKMQGCIGTNGKTWGAAVKASGKRPWWQIWGRGAAV